ncbi:MAG: hypothetical protein JSR60_11490 [Proteobacteria bacterium]|nr:hypothetical protein [Pseudomonadota bacterium]
MEQRHQEPQASSLAKCERSPWNAPELRVLHANGSEILGNIHPDAVPLMS